MTAAEDVGKLSDKETALEVKEGVTTVPESAGAIRQPVINIRKQIDKATCWTK